jgi:hypothetical protein
MAQVKAYVQEVTSIQEVASERFQVTLMVGITDTSHSQLSVSFEADWGADWKLIARAAIGQAFLSALGEEVVGIIWNDFSTSL